MNNTIKAVCLGFIFLTGQSFCMEKSINWELQANNAIFKIRLNQCDTPAVQEFSDAFEHLSNKKRTEVFKVAMDTAQHNNQIINEFSKALSCISDEDTLKALFKLAQDNKTPPTTVTIEPESYDKTSLRSLSEKDPAPVPVEADLTPAPASPQVTQTAACSEASHHSRSETPTRGPVLKLAAPEMQHSTSPSNSQARAETPRKDILTRERTASSPRGDLRAQLALATATAINADSPRRLRPLSARLNNQVTPNHTTNNQVTPNQPTNTDPQEKN